MNCYLHSDIFLCQFELSFRYEAVFVLVHSLQMNVTYDIKRDNVIMIISTQWVFKNVVKVKLRLTSKASSEWISSDMKSFILIFPSLSLGIGANILLICETKWYNPWNNFLSQLYGLDLMKMNKQFYKWIIYVRFTSSLLTSTPFCNLTTLKISSTLK